MNFSIPTNIAKYLFAAVMGIFGIMHFMNGAGMAGMVPSFLPGGVIWIYITGAALVAYAVATIMNHKLARMAGYLLALFMVLCVIFYHAPTMSTNPMAIIMILKDLALAAAAIYIANHCHSAE